MIPPIRVIGWTILGLIVMVYPWSAIYKFIFSAFVVAFTMFCTKKIQPGKYFTIVTFPLLIPLIIIHGIINPKFSISFWFWFVPYRPGGIEFGFLTYCNLAVIMAIATAWTQINRDDLFEWLVAQKVPMILIGITAQAFAMVTFIDKRGRAVFKAQTARGIRTGPSWMYRIKALPSIILPVVTSLVNEADQRSVALWSRGLLNYKISSEDVPPTNMSDIIFIFAPLILVIAIRLLK